MVRTQPQRTQRKTAEKQDLRVTSWLIDSFRPTLETDPLPGGPFTVTWLHFESRAAAEAALLVLGAVLGGAVL